MEAAKPASAERQHLSVLLQQQRKVATNERKLNMKRINLAVLGLAVAALLALPAMTQAADNKGIEGSIHDFSTNSSWNSRKGVCSPCHSAHNTDPNQVAPLWNHATTVGPFTPYDSPTFNAGSHQPGGHSLACLSCHDGTVAINQGISGVLGTNGPLFIDPGAQIGPDLHTTHPISFVYDSALAAADGGGLEDPSVYKIGDPKTELTLSTPPVPPSWSGTSLTGKTIEEALLQNGKMECSSCHDVHKQEGSSPSSGILARISGNDATGRGSTLCRTCHIK
jgi:hypothetical protein